MRNMENPFKFGTIVEENYFTDRVEEVAYIEQFKWTGDGEVNPES